MAGFELSARSIGLTSEDLDLRTWRAVIAEFVERLVLNCGCAAFSK